jgi:hypothetical protein
LFFVLFSCSCFKSVHFECRTQRQKDGVESMRF